MQLCVIGHNIRSTHNVGSILRTCDGFGVQQFIATGYTPYPEIEGDTRLPHIRNKINAQIHKTALGAQRHVGVSHYPTLNQAIKKLTAGGFSIFALEQARKSIFIDTLPQHKLPAKIALIVGSEPSGLTKKELSLAQTTLEIRMFGHKESFNVSVAAGIALYELTKSS